MAQSTVHVDVDGLNDALNLWRTQGDPLGCVWREELESIARHNYNNVAPSTIATIPGRSRKLLTTVETIVETLDALRAILAPDLNIAKQNLETVTRMCGLASLPDELLAEILTYAVMNDSSVVDVEKSLLLSVVSKLFRRLALTTGDLWTNITLSESSHPDSFVEACIARSGDRLVDITSTVDICSEFSVQRLSNFLAYTTTVTNRWQRFALELNCEPGDGGEYWNASFPALGMVFVQLNNLLLPNLREIAIYHKYPTWWDEPDIAPPQSTALLEVPFFGATWMAPKLRTLNLQNYIPHSPSLPFANVTTMEIHLSTATWSIDRFVKFLVACTSLTDLTVTLDTSRFSGGASARKSLSSIRKLKLQLLQEGCLPSLSLFTRSVGFPNCLHLDICVTRRSEIDSDVVDVESDDELNDDVLDLRDYGVAIFASVRSFPKVEVLRMEIKSEGLVASFTDTSLFLPLEKMPALRHLTLSCNQTIHLQPDLQPHNAHLRYPALETLVLETGYKHIKDWLGYLAAQLETQGDWGNFKQLRVRTRRKTSTGWTFKTIPKETMRSWFGEWPVSGTSPRCAIDLTNDA